jgi:hypothetical protein
MDRNIKIFRQLGTGLRDMPRNVQGVERGKEAADITVFLQGKGEKHLKYTKTFFWGGGAVIYLSI